MRTFDALAAAEPRFDPLAREGMHLGDVLGVGVRPVPIAHTGS